MIMALHQRNRAACAGKLLDMSMPLRVLETGFGYSHGCIGDEGRQCREDHLDFQHAINFRASQCSYRVAAGCQSTSERCRLGLRSDSQD